MSEKPSSPDEMAAQADAAMRAAAEIWTYLVLGWVITGLRTHSRVKQGGWRNLQADDAMAWLAMVFYALESGAAYASGAVAHGLANNGLSDEARARLSPADPEWQTRVIGSKIQLTGWLTYSAMVWCLKGSLLLFYLRLTPRTDPAARMRVFVGIGLVVCSWLAVFLTIFAECVPFEKNWQIYPDPGNSCNPASSVNILWVSVVMNVLTDVYIMAAPLPMLWATSLRPARKAALAMLFSCGVFVCACAAVRTALMLDDPVNSGAIAGLWSCRETLVATFAANLPAVFPLLKLLSGRLFASVVSGSLSRSSASSASAAGGGTAKGALSGVDHQRVHSAFGATAGSRSSRAGPHHHHNHHHHHRAASASLGTTTFIGGALTDSDDELFGLERHGLHRGGGSGGGLDCEKNIQMSQVVSVSRSPPGPLDSSDLPVMPGVRYTTTSAAARAGSSSLRCLGTKLEMVVVLVGAVARVFVLLLNVARAAGPTWIDSLLDDDSRVMNSDDV